MNIESNKPKQCLYENDAFVDSSGYGKVMTSSFYGSKLRDIIKTQTCSELKKLNSTSDVINVTAERINSACQSIGPLIYNMNINCSSQVVGEK